jgi:hypothetical protein
MTELLLTNTNNSWLAKKGLKHLLCEAPEVWLLLLLKYDCVKQRTSNVWVWKKCSLVLAITV